MGFWGYLGGTIIHPICTFRSLLTDPKHLAQGTKAILMIGTLYTLTVIGLAVTNTDITTPAWLTIPPEKYYFYEIFFAAPVFALGWLLAGGLVQVLSKAFKGSGTFEGTLATLGFALTIPSFVTWIPETIGALLFITGVITQQGWLEIITQPGFWKLLGDVYQFIALTWYVVLIFIAVAVTQKLKWWQSAIIGILTTVVVGLMMFTSIR